jgi:choline dehydrogenase-like flavoprotein
MGDGFSFQSIVSRPHSTGSVELKSTDPFDKPFISTGYFTDIGSEDLTTMREGIKLSRKLALVKNLSLFCICICIYKYIFIFIVYMFMLIYI